jgi:hypothetical protein
MDGEIVFHGDTTELVERCRHFQAESNRYPADHKTDIWHRLRMPEAINLPAAR